MTHQICQLHPLCFDEKGPLRRDDFFAPDAQFPDYAEKYDYHTLFYSAIDEGSKIRLMAPKLLNFEALAREGEFAVDGERSSIRTIKKYRRHAEIILEAPKGGDRVAFKSGDFTKDVPTLKREESLKGKNILLTRQKNNLLDWIKVWAAHHVAHQGVSAVVIVDNGSTIYTPQALSKTLAQIPGLHHSVVIDAPYIFGPMAKDRPFQRGLFYQAAMLNLVKHGFAFCANAVLTCVDVDELIFSENDETIFDEMERSRFGYVCAPGHWRYAKTASEPHILHSDHIYKSEMRDWSREKYCVKINGPMRRLPFDIHNVGRGRINKFFYSKTKGFYHCQQLSTSWSVDRQKPSVDDLTEDQVVENFFDANIRRFER